MRSLARLDYQNDIENSYNEDYFTNCFLPTVIVTPSPSTSAVQTSLSPQLSFNIFMISIGTIVLEDLPLVSACPIFVSYINFMSPLLVLFVFNICRSIIFNLIFYPISNLIGNFKYYYDLTKSCKTTYKITYS